MKTAIKKNSVIALTIITALCLALVAAFIGLSPISARADEVEYAAFVDVGANADAAEKDAAIGLTEKKATATVAGTVTTGSSLFTSYAEGATYSFALDAGTYQVAVAVIKEASTAVTVGGKAASLTGENGKTVFSTTATVTAGTPLTVAVTGKLCAVLVAAEGSKVLLAADYSDGQVIPYGALLSDVLDNAVGYYSDGSTKEFEITYGDIMAGGGVNVNYTTVDVTGTIEELGVSVNRYLTTMPDDLVYFINCGSFTTDGKYSGTADAFYSYNQTVFDYYGKDKLINYGTPDRKSTGADSWGFYTNGKDATNSAPGDATFPYNSLLWIDNGDATELGYRLTGLTASAKYRITIGTLSHWHARTATITFNGATVGASDLRIGSSKGSTTYENVTADGSGKIDVYMKGAKTNEPCINFIAVQPMEVEIAAVPNSLTAAPTVGMEDTTVTFTSGAQAGAKLQLYNVNKPNQMLWEEIVDAEKITDGEYTVDFGAAMPTKGVSQFNCVQITSGGTSAANCIVSVTDIQNFKIEVSTEEYTTGAVTVTVSAEASSGIAKWSYKKGEFGALNEFALNRPYKMEESFSVIENGDYYVVVTSGIGVTYSEIVTIGNIDPDRPVINVLPSASGWSEGSYNVTVTVDGVAPVTKYTLYKDGAQVASADSLPTNIKFTEEGNYTVAVTNAAGLTSMKSFSVSSQPTVTLVTKTFVSRTLKYTFGNTSDFEVASVTAYQLTSSGASRVTIASGNVLNVYNAGTYVVSVTTKSGETELFSIVATAAEVRTGKVNGTISSGGGIDKDTALGVGLGVGLGGAVLGGVAVVLVLFVFKKKKA